MRVGLAAVIGFGLGSAAPAAAGPLCAPAAELAGDPVVVDQVAVQLAVLGVGRPESDCPAVRAELRRDGERLAVAVAAPGGRTAARTVSDPRIAAAWIETWLRPEIGAPLLVGRAAPMLDVSSASAAGSPAVSVRSAPVGPAAWRPVHVALAGERMTGDDDSSWRGLVGAACVELGAVCLGGALRLADNQDVSNNSGLSSADRLAVDASATLALPLALDRMTLAPSLGVGLGWLRTRGVASADLMMVDCPAPPDPTMPNQDACAPTVAGLTRHSITPRVELGSSASFAISGGLRFVVAAALVLAPMADAEPARSGDVEVNADGTVSDPSRPGAGWPVELYELPGEPTRYTRLGAGLELVF